MQLYHVQPMNQKKRHTNRLIPGLVMIFFIGCFRGGKTTLRMSTFLALSFLFLASAFVRVEIFAYILF